MPSSLGQMCKQRFDSRGPNERPKALQREDEVQCVKVNAKKGQGKCNMKLVEGYGRRNNGPHLLRTINHQETFEVSENHDPKVAAKAFYRDGKNLKESFMEAGYSKAQS